MRDYLKRVPGLRKLAGFLRRQAKGSSREQVLRKMPKQSVCAEIGVHNGDYSKEILRHVRPTRLHLIDPWSHEEGEIYEHAWYGGGATGGQTTMDSRYRAVRNRFDREITSGRIYVHRGDSSEIADEFGDDYFDWVYIDGNHLYDYVKKDLELYYPKIRVGGYIAGDDYGTTGWWDNGVKAAVDEFVRERPQLSLKVIGSQFMIRRAA